MDVSLLCLLSDFSFSLASCLIPCLNNLRPSTHTRPFSIPSSADDLLCFSFQQSFLPGLFFCLPPRVSSPKKRRFHETQTFGLPLAHQRSAGFAPANRRFDQRNLAGLFISQSVVMSLKPSMMWRSSPRLDSRAQDSSLELQLWNKRQRRRPKRADR